MGPAFTVSAHADVTVSTPVDGAQLHSPFSLQAVASPCSSQAVAAMGYSLDNSTNTTIYSGASSIGAIVTASTGYHVLHVKSWGARGASCVTNISILVAQSPPMPPNVTVASNLQNQNNWAAYNDLAIQGGSSQGATALVSSPSVSGRARAFSMNFTNAGGQRFHTTFAADPAATHFVYSAQVMLTRSSQVAIVEMDMNQVMANGQTVIYGVQCDGYSNTWDYTVNTGTAKQPVDSWRHTNAPCNPANWSRNTWHSIQIAYSRDANGNVTYESATLDGVQSEFSGAQGNSAFALGWAPTLLTNFQVDGMGRSGNITAYLDNVTVYRW